jgi:hypothetical protein
LSSGSLTGYPQPELKNPNSKLIDQPVLFTKYSQMPQVMPDRNYSPDIMQQFIDKCTSIKDPKDQLLFKAYIKTLFIPDVFQAILLLKGGEINYRNYGQADYRSISNRLVDFE